jgi:RNA polymerase sigma factor (sigma-70 family)
MTTAHSEEDLDVLVLDARAGSGTAFTRLWERLAPVVAGYIRGRGVREIDDVTSDVFLAAFRGLDGFDGDGPAFRRWLFTIAHHRAVDALRKQARLAGDVPFESVQDTRFERSAESEALSRLEHAAALRLVHELPDDQRDVLLLRVVAGLSVEEVAVVLERSSDAVRQLHRRALVRLRELAAGPDAVAVSAFAATERRRPNAALRRS